MTVGTPPAVTCATGQRGRGHREWEDGPARWKRHRTGTGRSGSPIGARCAVIGAAVVSSPSPSIVRVGRRGEEPRAGTWSSPSDDLASILSASSERTSTCTRDGSYPIGTARPAPACPSSNRARTTSSRRPRLQPSAPPSPLRPPYSALQLPGVVHSTRLDLPQLWQSSWC